MIDTTSTLLIKRISEDLEKRANNVLRAFDLTISQMGALQELRRQPEGTMPLKSLERELHVAQSTAAGIVCRLEHKDFVESFGQADDKRIKVVRITDRGRQYCNDADADLISIEEDLLATLSDEERDTLLKLLAKLLPQG